MADTFSSSERSDIMRAVKSTNTRPELTVRRIVHQLGFRYRLHRGDLPGRPDLVFVRRKKVIFVHGCFWHRHACEAGRSTPASNEDYWRRKFQRNVRRDRSAVRQLRRLGWGVSIVWECQTKPKRADRLRRRLIRFLTEQTHPNKPR